MATVDVTVRGAGIFGLSVAWACAQRGAKVQVIDPGGVAAGASFLLSRNRDARDDAEQGPSAQNQLA